VSSSLNWVFESSLESTIRPGLPLDQPPCYPSQVEESSEGLNTICQVLRGYIPSLVVALLGRENVCSVDTYYNHLYGAVVNVTVDLPAREALELWLKLIDYLPYEKYGVVLSLKWLGENNVSEDEFINYMVKIMVKSKVGLKALPGFDAVHMVGEARR
jgi:hypothetical protein